MTWLSALCGAFLSVSICGASEEPLHPPIGDTPKNENVAADQRGVTGAPLAVHIVQSDEDKARAEKDERDRAEKAELDRLLTLYTGKIADYTNNLADYTAALAVFTFLLFGVGAYQVSMFRRQLRQMAQDSNDARRAAADQNQRAHELFVATHRPKLRVRWFFGLQVAAGQPIAAQIAVANIGGTGARIESVGVSFFSRTIGQAVPSQLPLAQNPLPGGIQRAEPGQQVNIGIEGPPIAEDILRAINEPAPTVELCLFGAIPYRDALNTWRVTGLFRIYDPVRQTFIRTNADDPFADLDYED